MECMNCKGAGCMNCVFPNPMFCCARAHALRRMYPCTSCLVIAFIKVHRVEFDWPRPSARKVIAEDHRAFDPDLRPDPYDGVPEDTR